jgi:hypothetical protein
MNVIYYYSVLITVLVVVFLVGQHFFNKRPDPLHARFHFATVLLWVASLLLLAEIIVFFCKIPDSSPFKARHPESAFLLVSVILLQRSQLSGRLKDRNKTS